MLLHTDALIILVMALVFDALIGDPDLLWRRWPHPVTWMGSMIKRLDKALDHDDEPFHIRRAKGVACLLIVLTVSGGMALALDLALRTLPGHAFLAGLIASTLIAQNSLYVHVARVRDAFASGGLTSARKAVSMIVGRDPDSLDSAGVCRAAIETTAENFSDGIVAPVFWFTVLGLPGLVIYKAVNTADSMIGHRSPRHEAFGWSAARLDDLVNGIPARLAGGLIALAAPLADGSPITAFKVMQRDARLHKSPNAGWPEAAMAGALNVALAGPRRYGARIVDDPFLHNEARKEATPDDIRRALKAMAGACLLQFTLIASVAFLAA